MYAKDYRAKARENMAGEWGLSILVAFIAAILGGLITGSSFSLSIDEETMATLPAFIVTVLSLWGSLVSLLGIVQFVLGGAVKLGYSHFLLGQHDHTEKDLKDLFSELNRLGAGFIMNLLTTIYTFLWGLLLIVPGIIAAYSYSMAPFILAENSNMTAKEAIAASKELMKGHKWQLFCLDMSFIGWHILCGLTAGIGYVVLNPYTNAARATFYRQLCPKQIESEPIIPTAEPVIEAGPEL